VHECPSPRFKNFPGMTTRTHASLAE